MSALPKPLAASLALAAFVLATAITATSGAQERRVVVIADRSDDANAAQIVAELLSMGMTVDMVQTSTGDLESLARARGAAAALRVSSSSDAVDIWVAPRPGAPGRGGPRAAGGRAFDRVEARPGDSAASLALRAVETLRGRLLPIPANAEATKQDAPPPASPAVARVAPEPPLVDAAPTDPGIRRPGSRPGVIAVHVGPGIVANPIGKISLSGVAVGGARWMVSRWIGGDLLAVIPVSSGTVSAGTGKAHLSAGVIGLGAWADLLDRALPVATGVGAGIGAGWISYLGQPGSSTVRGNDGTIPYALLYGRWAFEWRIHAPISIRLDAIAGTARPRPVFRLAGLDEDAVFGQPFLAFGLGVQMSLP